MTDDDPRLLPATVLRGHVSEDTAYLVDDYPYGYELRCRIRYWLHTGRSGATRGQVRLMSQTTNPKRPGEPWNKPRAATYTPWAVLVLDGRGHVGAWAVSEYGVDPWHHLAMRLNGAHAQLNTTERAGYDHLLRRSAIIVDPEGWARARRAYALVGHGADRDTLANEHRIHLRDADYAAAVAAHTAGLDF